MPKHLKQTLADEFFALSDEIWQVHYVTKIKAMRDHILIMKISASTCDPRTKRDGAFFDVFIATQKLEVAILARVVTTGKTRLKSVYDPTCGSGSLLLRVAREVSDVSDFFGQEMNRTTYNLARMNMILHGVHYRNFDLRQEDTLEHPQHEGQLGRAIGWQAHALALEKCQ